MKNKENNLFKKVENDKQILYLVIYNYTTTLLKTPPIYDKNIVNW